MVEELSSNTHCAEFKAMAISFIEIIEIILEMAQMAHLFCT